MELLNFFAIWWILAQEKSQSWNLMLLRCLQLLRLSQLPNISFTVLVMYTFSGFGGAKSYYGSIHWLVHSFWMWLLWQHSRYLNFKFSFWLNLSVLFYVETCLCSWLEILAMHPVLGTLQFYAAGIGGQTALKLIRQHGSIESILENINKERSIYSVWLI